MPVQKQTRAGQRTRFKAFVAIGDYNGHVGLGVKCSKEVATAIRGAIILAKLSIVPVRRGYWGNKIGRPHTVPCKVNIAKKLFPHCIYFVNENVNYVVHKSDDVMTYALTISVDWQVRLCSCALDPGAAWYWNR